MLQLHILDAFNEYTRHARTAHSFGGNVSKTSQQAHNDFQAEKSVDRPAIFLYTTLDHLSASKTNHILKAGI